MQIHLTSLDLLLSVLELELTQINIFNIFPDSTLISTRLDICRGSVPIGQTRPCLLKWKPWCATSALTAFFQRGAISCLLILYFHLF